VEQSSSSQSRLYTKMKTSNKSDKVATWPLASYRVKRSRKDRIRRDCIITTNVAAFKSYATQSLLYIKT
jgi:hypothetical protein